MCCVAIIKKSFGSAADISTNKAAPWLYNLGVAGQVASKVELYGSYSRGLEEAGIAPANASNRNAVLNAVIVTQRELGLKVALQDTLSLVIAGFDTRKPYAGLDANSNIYGLVGTVRHRGMEASLSGEVAEGMSVVLGGVWIDAKLMGEAVQDGLIGDRPVGVPNARLIASVDYRLPGIEELSVDAGVTYESASAASTKIGEHGQLKVPSTTAVNLGMRYEFSFAHRPATLRVQMLNLLNSYSWDISSAETFSYSAPRRARLVLSTAF